MLHGKVSNEVAECRNGCGAVLTRIYDTWRKWIFYLELLEIKGYIFVYIADF